MADYLVQEDGTSRFILEDSSGDILLDQQTTTAPPFIASVTSVHAPTLGFIGSITLSTPGTYTWVCPAGITTVDVICYGGGGGGGASTVQGGVGGGGGAFAERVAVPVTPGTSYTFVVGAPGAGQVSSPGTIGNGTSSTFTGDSGVQVIAVGGGGGEGPNTPGAGGLASASTGDTGLKFDGGSGGAGGGFAGTTGGGGASGNVLANGAAGTTGAAGIGANGGGSGGYTVPGFAPGGGGGSTGGTNAPGAAGGNGQVSILVATVLPSFIASNTVVYTPTLAPHETFPSFIASVTSVYTPTISSTDVRVPFIDSHTVVYQPTLRVAFTGGGVSQVALEVLTSDSTADAYVSQVTLEIIVPWYKGLHVWEKTGQTGG